LFIKHDVANVNRHDCAASLCAINSYQSGDTLVLRGQCNEIWLTSDDGSH